LISILRNARGGLQKQSSRKENLQPGKGTSKRHRERKVSKKELNKLGSRWRGRRLFGRGAFNFSLFLQGRRKD